MKKGSGGGGERERERERERESTSKPAHYDIVDANVYIHKNGWKLHVPANSSNI